MSGHDYTKLPRWVQDEITELQRQVARLIGERDTRAKLLADPASARVRLVGYGEPDRGLPDQSTVSFDLGANGRVEAHVVEEPTGAQVLVVHANNLLDVRPRAGNSIGVIAVRR